jgi:hypothetical protein
MYMKPPKLRRTSKQLLTSSWRRSVSARNSPSQFRQTPATVQARRSFVPRQPQVPRVKRPIATGKRTYDSESIQRLMDR